MSALTNEVLERKVVLLGSGSVGKSALTIQFTSRIFQTNYEPTIEDYFVQNTIIDGKQYRLNILDTAGEDDSSLMREKYFIAGDVFILVYNITDRTSFSIIEDLVKNILRIKDKTSFPIVIVGNKCDLADQRAVTEAEGKKLATDLGCGFIESTAKSYDSAFSVFEAACKKVEEFEEADSKDGKKKKKGKKRCNLL